MERLELKASITADPSGTIIGTAWPFGAADSVGDIIEKGAFTSPAKLPMLFAHDQAQPIGIWESVSETPEGLVAKGRLLVDDVQRAREIHALIKTEAVTGLSIGFVTRKATPRRGGGRTITALDLHEISVVPIPCNQNARVTSIKAADAATLEDINMETETITPAPELAAMEAKFAERLDKLEAKMNRPTIATTAEANTGIEAKAFTSFIRKGVERMPADEVKALTVAVDASAGYLAPETFASEIIKLLVQYSPIRQYAKVMTIGASEIKYPRRLTGTTATWVAETADRTSSQPSYEQITLTPHELATYTDISNALLEDSVFDMQAELASEFAENFGVTEGSAFINGTGIGQPKGLLATGAIANELKTGVASDFPASNPADKIIDLFHKLPGVHAQNAVWLMNRNTLSVIRKWKDTAGNYLVTTPIFMNAPSTLLGRPIVEAVDMPDIGAGTNPIIFGDFSGYRIIDRISLNVLRDPFSLATKGQVRFHARRRVGADITHPDRFIRLKCSV